MMGAAARPLLRPGCCAAAALRGWGWEARRGLSIQSGLRGLRAGFASSSGGSGLETRGTFGAKAQSAPRYMGIPTFMRSPLRSIEDALTPADGKPNGLDVAMLGVPFDGGVTNRPGARHGPREVRVQSANMRGIHRVHEFSPFEVARVADVGDVALGPANFGSCGPAHAEIASFVKPLVGAGVLPLSCGGDHSVTLPLLEAVRSAQPGPLGLIHVDAHTDTWDELWGESDHHGAPIRRAVERAAHGHDW